MRRRRLVPASGGVSAVLRRLRSRRRLLMAVVTALLAGLSCYYLFSRHRGPDATRRRIANEPLDDFAPPHNDSAWLKHTIFIDPHSRTTRVAYYHPPLPVIGPDSFRASIAEIYAAKSPVDGSRIPCGYDKTMNLRRFDDIREPEGSVSPLPPELASTGARAKLVRELERVCSPPAVPFAPSSLEMPGLFAALEMGDVCVTHNIDSSKRVQRGIVVFDPYNESPRRCVPCPNPIEVMGWGPHACGQMWAHQINARGLDDLRRCYSSNARAIRDLGQRQSPLHSSESSSPALVYGERTLLLSYVRHNPGHQLFDTLLSLVPLLLVSEEVDAPHRLIARVVVHQDPDCPPREWICAILRRIGALRDDGNGSEEGKASAGKMRLAPVPEGMLTCFSSLIVPRWGLAREVAIPAKMLRKFKEIVHTAFALDGKKSAVESGKSPMTILFYGHSSRSKETGNHRRMWIGMNETVAGLVFPTTTTTTMTTRILPGDLGDLSVEHQAREFHGADVLIAPHGGHIGNVIFMREGSAIVEISCIGYSHLATSYRLNPALEGTLTRAWGLLHVILRPCGCLSRGNPDSDFRISSATLAKLLETIARARREGRRGTFTAGALSGEREGACYQ